MIEKYKHLPDFKPGEGIELANGEFIINAELPPASTDSLGGVQPTEGSPTDEEDLGGVRTAPPQNNKETLT